MRKAQQPSRSKPSASKPLCSCAACKNNQCPNVLETIPPLPSQSCKKKPFSHFNPKVTNQTGQSKGKGKKSKPSSQRPSRMSIVEAMNDQRDCGCEVMARAIASHLHVNLGLGHKRDAINAGLLDLHNDEVTQPPQPSPEQ